MLDRKPNTYHHCNILGKYHILNWENLTKYTEACLMFKNLNGKTPPPLSNFIKQKNLNNGSTRPAQRGDCKIPFSSTLPIEIENCTTPSDKVLKPGF